MKKNRLFVLGIITMFVAILSLTLVSGTMARYTSTVSGSDTATVAKWQWSYKGSTITNYSNPVTFGLFDTINDTLNGADEEDVADELIAPGTKGSFELKFKNESEVTGKVSVSFSSSEEVKPIVYSLDGTNWVGTIAELNFADEVVAMGAELTKTVYWQWAFEETSDGWTNADDTALGLNPVDHTVTLTVVFDQVD